MVRPDMTIEKVLQILRVQPFISLQDEKRLQAEMFTVLQQRAPGWLREYCPMGSREPFDLYHPSTGIVIEVKLKGSKLQIFRQLERYALQPDCRQIVLVTAIHMGLPPDIQGKPAYLHSLSRAWL